jgi:hypothetical protein
MVSRKAVGRLGGNPIEVFGGEPVDCCRSKHVLYLEIGPYPIAVPVAFPVVALRRGAMLQYQWLDGFPEENILGMEAILNQRMLCFTPDSLFVFENRP